MNTPVRFRKVEPLTSVPRLVMGLALLASIGLLGACQKSEPAATNVNSSTGQAAASPTAAPNATATEPKPAAEVPATPVAFSLATPTDTYKTAYQARKDKDIATLKRVFAKDVLEFLTEMAGVEKKTLDDQLKELTEKPQAATPDTRNEKINGKRATLEYLDEKGKWTTMDFSKDGNDWKIDLPKAE